MKIKILIKNFKLKIKNSRSRVRLRTWIALGIILVLSPIILYAAFRPGSTEADWFDTAWGFRKKVPITNSSGSEQTDFQVQITLDTSSLIAAGKMQADCDDVRVTDINGKVLPYWIEPNTCNTSETLVWAKVPSIPTDGADLYIYYGNASASSASSTENVFIRDMESAVAAWPMQEEASTTLSYAEAKHPSDAEGRDIVINGGFDTDSIWVKGTGWTISDGVAHANIADGNSLRQDSVPIIQGKTYQFVYTISNYSSGSIQVRSGSNLVNGTLRSANGTYTENIVGGDSSRIAFWSVGGFVGDIDNVLVKQINIPSSGDFDGSELVTDGDMEAADTNAWIAQNNATISKETTNPHGGSQVLRIAYNGTSNPIAAQTGVVETGKRYRVHGFARSDGVSVPRLYVGTTASIWVGDTSTTWQEFDIETISTGSEFKIYASLSVSGYVEFDDVSVTEISPLSGSTPTDDSTNRPTLGADSSSGHLSNAYTFDGSNDYVDIYSSDLNSVFNPDEGTLVAWAKVSDSSVWSDGAADWIVNMRVDSNNIVQFFENNGNLYTYYYAGGTQKSISHATTTTEWFQVVLTWNASSDEAKFYFNGSQQGSTQTGLGTWIGNLSSTQSVIGALNNSGNSSWSGDINDVRLYNHALSPDEIASLYSASTDIQAYYTENYEGRELIRKYDDDNITVGSLGAEEVGPGPVAYWKFDEGADNTCPGGEDVCDATENSVDGNISGSVTWQTEDKCINGKCLYFDGSNDYVSLGSSKLRRDDLTVCGWFRPVSLSDRQDLIGSGNRGSFPTNNWILSINGNTGSSGKISVFGDATELSTDSVVLSANSWQHICFTNDGSVTTIYLNGNSVKSDNHTINNNDSSGEYIVPNVTPTYKGFIDEVKIYPYARTADQIKTDYNQYAAKLGVADQGNLSDGLVGYWSMDESSGTTVADKSGNGNNGTLTNAQENGTSDGSGNSTTTLVDTDGTLSSTDDAYNGMVLSITDDATCPLTANAERVISDYDQASKTFTVSSAFSAAPDTCNYTVLHQVGGKFGNGVEFDGETDYIDMGSGSSYDFQNTQSFTINAWARLSRSPSTQQIIHNGRGTQRTGYEIGIINGNWRFMASDTYDLSSDHVLDYATAPSINTWYMVTWSIDRNTQTATAYIDGDKIGSLDISSVTGVLGYSNLDIGRDTNGLSSRYWSGNIDEVRIYNRALSAAEVKQLYQWAPGPVGYWNFDEGSGSTAFDRSGNGLNASFSNMESEDWTQGMYGGALSFDGSDEKLTFSNIGNYTKFATTVEAWIKPRALDANQTIASLGGGTSSWAPMFWLANNNKFIVQTSSARYKYGGSAIDSGDLNQWMHVAFVIDDHEDVSSWKIFINGVDDGSGGIADSEATNYFGNTNYIGGRSTTSYFNGLIDDVKIYNYARTAEQIRQDMAGTTSPGVSSGAQLPQPVAHWRFDEQSGQTAHDSIADNDGMLGADANASSDDPTWKTESDCKVNGCLSFDGSNDFVTLTDNGLDVGSNDFTITTWINGTNSPSQPFFVDKRRTYGLATAGYTLLTNSSGYVQLRLADGTNGPYVFNGTSNILDSNWHHVAAVINRIQGTVTLYVDGKSQGGNQTINSLLGNLDNALSARLGTKDLTATNAFNGKMDELRIYNSALSAEQVLLDMSAGKAMTFGSVSGASEASDLANGAGDPPVAEWRFDEKTGTTANDTSGNGNDGSITGATWTSGCKQGACLSFDSTNDYLNMGDPASLRLTSAGTIEAWIYPKSYPSSGWKGVINKGNWGAGRNYYSIYYSQAASTIRFDIGDATATYSISVNWTETPLDTWSHVTLIWNGSQVSAYINGAFKDSAVQSGNPDTSTYNLYVGSVDNGTSYVFDGLIDHVKIYDYARTPAQIAYDYNRGAPIAHWKFDECEGSTIHDSAGTNNGTLTVTTTGGNSAGVGTCNTANSAWGSGASGKFGASLNFDGDGDCVDLGDTFNFDLLKPFSMSAWIKRQAGGITIMGKYGGQTRLTLDASGTLQFTRSGVTIESSYDLGTNQWYLVTATYDGINLRMYVDGKSVSDPVASGSISSSSTPFLIGAQYNSGSISHYFNGQIDDVRIYNYALSAAQVRKLYNGGFSTYFGP